MAIQLETGEEASLAFCNHLLQVLRLIRLYDTDNVNFEGPLTKLKDVIVLVSDRAGSARLQSEEGMLYFNKEPVRGGRRAFGTIQGMVKALEQLGIAEVAFTGAISVGDLRKFCELLKPEGNEQAAPLERIKEGLNDTGLRDRVQVYAPGETTGSAQVHQVEIDEKTYFPLAYARTLVLLREYVRNLLNEELNRYFAQKLHRGIQELCALVNKYPHKFLAMGSVKGTAEHLFNHMANTGFLAILLGHNLGFGKLKLSELGMAAMLHGLGKFRGRHELLGRAELSGDDAREMALHPYRAMGALLEGRKVTPKMLATATTAFQYDLHRGRTPVRIPPTLHPFAMIVRICEEYDTLTSALDDRDAMPPDQALKQMIESPPGRYDPLILTAFVNMMGLFPTGTVVSLSTGEVAVVVHPNPERPKRPLVAVVLGPNGEPVDGEMLDLAEKGPQGTYPSTITGSLDPKELGINVPDYLL